MVVSLDSHIDDENEDLENEFKFEPPLYRQRYGKVSEILIDEKWKEKLKSLVDFGCAEFKLFVYVKSTSLTRISFVDIDEDLLQEKIMLIHPLTVDYLKRRQQPLKVSVFAGSVVDPDFRLADYDVVTAIELVEHLFPDELEAFTYNIFHYIKPKMAIITTPNADFNVVFSTDPLRFRHPDHKFEWTRQQFEEWAKNITLRFPDFTVSFFGIGDAPESINDNIGGCSQMALFLRKDLTLDNYSPTANNISCTCDRTNCKNSSLENLCRCICASCLPTSSYGISTYYSHSKQKNSIGCKAEKDQNIYYKCLKEISYPVDDDCRTKEEKLFDEICYRINTSMTYSFIVENMELKGRYEIPLTVLLMGTKDLQITTEELRKLLKENDYIIEDCTNQEKGILEACVVISPPESDMEDISSSSDIPAIESDGNKYCLNEEPVSDWDDTENIEKKCTSSTKDTSKKEIAELKSQLSHGSRIQDVSLLNSSHQKSIALVQPNLSSNSEDVEETDLFDDSVSTPSLSSEDNKVHLKRAITLEKQAFCPIPLPPDIRKLKIDVNRINELDRYHNFPMAKIFLNHKMKSGATFRKTLNKERDSVPGPSNVTFPPKKRKRSKKTFRSEYEDNPSLADVKSITNCIVQNVLNKLDIIEEINCRDDVIEFNICPEDSDDRLKENNEGSNDNSWENEVENIQNDQKDGLKIEEFQNAPIISLNSNHNEASPDLENDELQSDTSSCIGRASNEAIVDGDSEQDSLADFEIPPPIQEANEVFDAGSIFLIGIQPRHSSHEEINNLPGGSNSFPHWLLQILGSQIHVRSNVSGDAADDPHNFCQGDGLGVHPSVNTVEDDETTESSNNTIDYAEMDPGVSSQDTSSLPEDLQELEDGEMQPTSSNPNPNPNLNSYNSSRSNIEDPGDNV